MQDLTGNKERLDIGNGNEIESLQSLALLESEAIDNANSRILKYGNVLSVKEHAISPIEGEGKLKEFCMGDFEKRTKIEKGDISNW